MLSRIMCGNRNFVERSRVVLDMQLVIEEQNLIMFVFYISNYLLGDLKDLMNY